MSAVDQPAPYTDAAELREAIVRLQATISTIVSRLDRLEKRRAAAPQQHTVAKAQQPAKKWRSKADLMTLVEAYIDSPTQVGALNSIIQSGNAAQVCEAEKVLVQAKRNHEAQRVRAERRGWQ